MRSVLEQIDDPQALLVLYAAGELSAADQASVEARLAADAALRESLARLEPDIEAVASAIAHADRRDASASAAAWKPGGALERSASRAIRQWSVELKRQVLAQRQAHDAAGMRRTWLIAAAASIVLAVGTFVWWGIKQGDRRFIPAPSDVATALQQQQSAEDSASNPGESFARRQPPVIETFDSSTIAMSDSDIDAIVQLREMTQ